MSMGATIAILLITAAVAGLVIALKAWNRRMERLRAERTERARMLGWRVEEAEGTFRFTGTRFGLNWELRRDPDKGESESSPYFVFRCPDVRASRLEWVLLSGMVEKIAYTSFGRAMIGWAGKFGIQRKDHADSAEFYRESERVTSDLTVFQKEWVMRARDPNRARAVGTVRLAELLTHWPKHSRAFRPEAVVNAQFDETGLTVECKHDLEEMALIEHLVAIGCTLAEGLSDAYQSER